MHELHGEVLRVVRRGHRMHESIGDCGVDKGGRSRVST